ncbi:hypothetical protein [Neorhizobium sp. P12A]|uniref:hypothetical protein n=1 Tax=Neorhizobium sp. P12A TaxID=2268027 RepID=UPI0011EE2779|nr:hypothetical protein [Neorhizobium sp. P12A]
MLVLPARPRSGREWTPSLGQAASIQARKYQIKTQYYAIENKALTLFSAFDLPAKFNGDRLLFLSGSQGDDLLQLVGTDHVELARTSIVISAIGGHRGFQSVVRFDQHCVRGDFEEWH